VARRGVFSLQVELRTSDGGLVVRAVLPPFDPPPDVLLWGARVFRYDRDGRYLEAFAFAVLPQMELS
jgi:hypothetical protein